MTTVQADPVAAETAAFVPPDHKDLIRAITKEFGAGAILQGQTDQLRPDIRAISTGSMLLDIATGIGGIPRGRVVEIYGRESAGKSTLSIHLMAEAMRAGGSAAYIDAEHAMDPVYAANCGLDVERLLISQPDHGEQALNIVDRIVSSSSVDVVVVDSVAALVPLAEVENDIGDLRIGLQAKMMSEALRKLNPKINRSKTAVVFINQIREKIGGYGNPETTPGGRALKFYASMRIEMTRMQAVKEGNRAIGNRVRANIRKNKVAPPFRQAEFDIIFNQGISVANEIVDAGEHLGIITRKGSYYYYQDDRLGLGKEAASRAIKHDPVLSESIAAGIRDRMDDFRSPPPANPDHQETEQ